MSEKRIVVWIQAFKDRKNLMLQWRDPDTQDRKSKSANTADMKEAEIARRDLEYQLNHGLYKAIKNEGWDWFRQSFEESHLANLREMTREKYKTVLDVFEQICKPKDMKSIQAKTITAFIKGMGDRKQRGGRVGLAPWTIRNYLVALKKALTWAVGQDLMDKVPTFTKIVVPKKKPQAVPAEAFEKLLDKAPDQIWKTYLLCGWWAGLRLSEAADLLWEPSEEKPWLDLAQNRIVLPAKSSKNNEDQWAPLHPTLRKAIEDLPRTSAKVFPFKSRKGGGPLTRNGITNRVLDMAKQAGVKLGMHKLRKGFGCRVAKQLGKGNAPILHTLMRHSSMQITMDFYANVDSGLQEAINTLT